MRSKPEQRDGYEAMRQDIDRSPTPEGKAAGPVLFAKGALYGYCPRCAAPGIRRLAGKDLCQGGHQYPSTEAKPNGQHR